MEIVQQYLPPLTAWYLHLSLVGKYMMPTLTFAVICFGFILLRALYEAVFQCKLFITRRLIPWCRKLPGRVGQLPTGRREPSLDPSSEDAIPYKSTLKERIAAMQA